MNVDLIPGVAPVGPRRALANLVMDAQNGPMSQTIYEAVGGMPALAAVARSWHRRCLADPVLNHPFSHPGQHPEHTARLAAYWAEALGGPPLYSHSMGDQTQVQRMHSGNGAHPEMDRRAVELFVLALDDAGLPADPALRATLTAYFDWSTRAMAAHPGSPEDVPDGAPMPRWSWDGPVQA